MARYLVGPNQTYRKVQDAIDAVGVAVGASDFVEQHQVFIAESGVYEGFSIEPGSLSPNSQNRLWVGAGNGIDALITKGEVAGKTGCLIGSDVPYVTIRGLTFKDLDRGVVVGVNSHRAEIDRCRFLSCSEVGVWVYQADECFLSNTYIHNSETCVAAQKAKGIALAHCTLYNDSQFADKSYLMFLELEEANQNIASKTGEIYLYNNIFYNHASFGLAIYRKHIQRTSTQRFIYSDHNDWYFPTAGKVAGGDVTSALVEVREVLSGGGVDLRYATELKPESTVSSSRDAWTVISGEDQNSLSTDPRFAFVKPNYSQENPAPRVPMLVTEQGPPALCGDINGYLPSWVDDSFLCVDLGGEPRTAFPTIGATEVQVTADYDVLDDLGGTGMDCDPDPVDPIATKYEENVPLWLPKIHKGIFYARDEQYYLYVDKQSTTIDNVARYTWNLSSLLLLEGIKVYAAGVEVTDTVRWNLAGYTFSLYQDGIGVFDDVKVEGYTRYWDAEAHAFKRNSPGTLTTHRLRAVNAVVEYVLPSKPLFGAPVIVTDDLLRPTDSIGLAQEFRIDYDAKLDEAKLVFGGAQNLWKNPDFAYVETGAMYTGASYGETGAIPLDYEYSGSDFVGAVSFSPATETEVEILPLRAGRALMMGPGDSETWIGQRIPVDPDQPYTISAYGSALSNTETGSFQVSLTFYDWDHTVLGRSGPFDFACLPSSTSIPDWKRLGLNLYNVEDSTPGRPPLTEFVDSVVSTAVGIPADTDSVFVQIKRGAGNPALLLDCIQFEKGYEATEFTRIPDGRELTIEWEGGEGRFHIIKDMNLHPIRHASPSGFVTINPHTARQWDDTASSGTNVLTDYGWSYGRLNVLPWAKMSGFNKYTRRVWFSTIRQQIDETVSISTKVAQPARVEVAPDLIVSTAGSDGDLFHVRAWDKEENLYSFETVRLTLYDEEIEFPGYIVRSDWSVPVELGQQIITELDEAGSKTFRYLPPDPEDMKYVGDKPSVINDTTGDFAGTPYGYISTRYRVLPENHGAATIRDQLGTSYDLTGALVEGVYYGQHYDDGVTRIKLPKFPHPGTVEIWGTETGTTHEIPIPEMRGTPLVDRHMSVDYQRGQMSIRGYWPMGFKVKYNPRMTWYNYKAPRRLYISKEILDQITGDIEVNYDAEMKMTVEAMPHRGFSGTAKYKTVRVVVQHEDR